jgi:hypothetical protein
MCAITRASQRFHFARISEWCDKVSRCPAMMPTPSHRGKTMNSKLLGAALVIAAMAAFGPVEAARMHHGGGCSGANLEKTETAIEAMADGDARSMAQREVAAAQDALLSGKMGACGVHLTKAMQAGMIK